MQFEFLVEWNSYLAVALKDRPHIGNYIKWKHPDIRFDFWPSFIAPSTPNT